MISKLGPDANRHDGAPRHRIAGFPVGFDEFHPDVSVNYQLNRFSDGSPRCSTRSAA
jgi:hypothetical protein